MYKQLQALHVYMHSYAHTYVYPTRSTCMLLLFWTGAFSTTQAMYEQVCILDSVQIAGLGVLAACADCRECVHVLRMCYILAQ